MEASEIRSALAVIARVLRNGESTHPPASARHWLRLNVRQHLAAACIHAEKALIDLTDEDHLAHFVARGLLALEQRERLRLSESSPDKLCPDCGRRSDAVVHHCPTERSAK